MALSSFILTICPIDGIVINNSNCTYVNSILGSDNNAGTRENPIATITKAFTLGHAYIYIIGIFPENINYSGSCYIFSDQKAALTGTVNINVPYDSSTGILYGIFGNNVNISNGTRPYRNSIYNSVVTNLSHGQLSLSYRNKILITNNLNDGTIGNPSYNLTIKNYLNYKSSLESSYDGIIYGSIDLYNYTGLTVANYPIFNNYIIRKAVAWKWNGVVIPITYTTNTGNVQNDSAQWKVDIFNALTTYYNTLSSGASKTYLASILSNWTTIFPSTTLVVDDLNCCPIFNRYVDGNPVDYSLRISNTNPALTGSSVGSYIGAYKASITPVYDLSTLKELDNNGNETVNTPDILVIGGAGNLYPSPSATQYRNRIKTNVLSFPRGYAFDGVQSLITSGLASHYNYGKRQAFTTLSNPQESIEVEPYNSLTEASAFPKFSAKLNGQTQMFYNITGAGTVSITTGGVITGNGTSFNTQFTVGQMIYVGTEGHAVTGINSATSMTVASWSVAVAAGSSYASVPTNRLNTPLLFSDLATYYNISSDLNLTEYGSYAVTNADYESYLLSSKTGVTLRSILLKYLKFVVNINYYD